jgi:hypothetical protein
VKCTIFRLVSTEFINCLPHQRMSGGRITIETLSHKHDNISPPLGSFPVRAIACEGTLSRLTVFSNVIQVLGAVGESSK